jgi:hypothetical protein
MREFLYESLARIPLFVTDAASRRGRWNEEDRLRCPSGVRRRHPSSEPGQGQGNHFCGWSDTFAPQPSVLHPDPEHNKNILQYPGSPPFRSHGAWCGSTITLTVDTTEEHYIGLTFEADRQQTSRIEAVLKMNGGQYREFLVTLERLTGRKAINTSKVPTVVQYGL